MVSMALWFHRKATGLLVVLVCLFAPTPSIAQPSDDERTKLVVEALTRLGPDQVNANPKLKEALDKVLAATRGTAQFVELVRQFKVKGESATLIEFAAKNPSDAASVDAMRVVLSDVGTSAIQPHLVGTNGAAFAELLGKTGDKRALPLLDAVVADSSRELAVRKASARALAQTHEGASALLRLGAEDKLSNDLKFTVGSALRSARWPQIKAEAAKLFPPPQGQNAEPLPPVSALMKRNGDAQRGAQVYRRQEVGCINCHQVHGEGIDFGPKLSEIGTKLGKEALYESILDPNSGISFGYEAWQVELSDGEEAFGLIVSETADELAVKAQNGTVTKYKKSSVARRQQMKTSIMPSGLQQTMSTPELVDLVEYLTTLKASAN